MFLELFLMASNKNEEYHIINIVIRTFVPYNREKKEGRGKEGQGMEERRGQGGIEGQEEKEEEGKKGEERGK